MADFYNPYNTNPGWQPYTPTMPAFQQFNAGYNPYANKQPVQNSNQNTFQWVQGQAAAEAYLVAPGNSVILMDSNAPVIYYKSADASGRYLPMKTYDLVERTAVETVPNQQAQFDTSSFVKRDEIADLIAKEVDRQLSAPAK